MILSALRNRILCHLCELITRIASKQQNKGAGPVNFKLFIHFYWTVKYIIKHLIGCRTFANVEPRAIGSLKLFLPACLSCATEIQSAVVGRAGGEDGGGVRGVVDGDGSARVRDLEGGLARVAQAARQALRLHHALGHGHAGSLGAHRRAAHGAHVRR
eukprot:IDg8240t1